MHETEILGIRIDNMGMAETIEKVKASLSDNSPTMICTPNSEIIYMAKKDAEFSKVLNASDINIADGIGVIYASKILNDPIPERVPGFDLACRLLPYMNENKLKLFLFGGKPGIAEQAAKNILFDYPDINICGMQDGYSYTDDDIISKINAESPEFLFVCLGAPKQEKWMYNNKSRLKCSVMLGIGGSLDVFAGNVKRSPDIFIKLNIEWLYRLITNPSRIGRMMSLPKFGLSVIKSKYFKKG